MYVYVHYVYTFAHEKREIELHGNFQVISLPFCTPLYARDVNI